MRKKAMELVRIPLRWLEASSANVRRASLDEGAMAELRASIVAHGLLHPLIVEQQASNRASVIAGGRRLAALQQLANIGAWPEGQPVPCVVVSGADSARDISLAENSGREPLHPVDEAEAFRSLRGNGFTDKELARRFGISPRTVQRRLRMARAAPELRDQCRNGRLSLGALEAVAEEPDRELQVKAVRETRYALDRAMAITDWLLDQRVPLHEPMVKFVGQSAYEAAGGRLLEVRGLPYLRDKALLEKLALGKLEEAAELERAKGWTVQVSLKDAPYARCMYSARGAETPDDVPFHSREGAVLHLRPGWNGEIAREVLHPAPARKPADSALGKGIPKSFRRDLRRMRMHVRRPALAGRPDVARDLLLVHLCDRIHGKATRRPQLLGVHNLEWQGPASAQLKSGTLPESVAAADQALDATEQQLLGWREHGSFAARWQALRAMGDADKASLLACCVARLLGPQPPDDLEPALAELAIDWGAEFDPGPEVLGRYTAAQLLEIAKPLLPENPEEQWRELQARGSEAATKHLPAEAAKWKGLASLAKPALAAVLADWIAVTRASDGRSPWIPDEIAGIERKENDG